MIKLITHIFVIVFIGFLIVIILAKTATNTTASPQQNQQLQAFIDSVTFSH